MGEKNELSGVWQVAAHDPASGDCSLLLHTETGEAVIVIASCITLAPLPAL
jgi:hypothetical protein